MRVYEHMKRAHKHKYVQIILVLLHPYQQVWYLCVDGVTNSWHIMEHLTMRYRLGHSHLNKLWLPIASKHYRQLIMFLIYANVSSLESRGLFMRSYTYTDISQMKTGILSF